MQRVAQVVGGMTLGEIFAFAIEREIEAQQFYKDALDIIRDMGARTMLGDLKQQEIQHEKMLREARTTGKVETIGRPRGLNDLGLADLLPEIVIGPHSTPQEILMAAIKREAFSVALYAAAETAVDNLTAQKLFAHLRIEEGQHKAILENLYDEHILIHN
jgi:rubrerythrin